MIFPEIWWMYLICCCSIVQCWAQQYIAHPFGRAVAAFRNSNCSGLLIDRAEKQFGWWGHLGNSAGLESDSHRQGREWAKRQNNVPLLMSWLDLFLLAVNVLDDCDAEERRVCSWSTWQASAAVSSNYKAESLVESRWYTSDMVQQCQQSALRSGDHRCTGLMVKEDCKSDQRCENAKICEISWNWMKLADQWQPIAVLLVASMDSPHFTDHLIGDRWKCNAQHFRRSQACSAWSNAMHWLQSSLEFSLMHSKGSRFTLGVWG